MRPVDDLIEGVERIATGDLGSRVPITGADELAVLGRAVNEMTERLAAHDAEMRASRARIVAASDEARRNVERDLHDGAQQYLVLLQLRLGQARRILETDPHEAAAAIDEATEELGRALAELRDLAHGIYPAVLESDGLPGSVAGGGGAFLDPGERRRRRRRSVCAGAGGGGVLLLPGSPAECGEARGRWRQGVGAARPGGRAREVRGG